MSDWTVVDVKPHIMLCPLPKGFWWEVEFIMSLNSCHMRLIHKGPWWDINSSVGDITVVREVSEKTPEQITKHLIEGSYTVWQDYFRKVDARQQDWVDTAREVQGQLTAKGPAKLKFKIDRVK